MIDIPLSEMIDATDDCPLCKGMRRVVYVNDCPKPAQTDQGGSIACPSCCFLDSVGDDIEEALRLAEEEEQRDNPSPRPPECGS